MINDEGINAFDDTNNDEIDEIDYDRYDFNDDELGSFYTDHSEPVIAPEDIQDDNPIEDDDYYNDEDCDCLYADDHHDSFYGE